MIAVLYKPFSVPSRYFEREMPGGRMAGKVKGRIVTLAKRRTRERI